MRRALAVAAAGLALGGCSLGGSDNGDKGSKGAASGPRPSTRVEVVEGQGEGGGFDARAIYRAESPGVVTVVSLFGGGGISDLLGDGGGGGSGVGSGFVVNGDGEIATNAHVVSQGDGADLRRARQVFVEFADGNRVEAKIVGADPNADVALLRVPTQGLTLRPLALGQSSAVQVGEPVAAIGSPFGEKQSLSVGVISAKDRSIQSLTNFCIPGAFQTDAAINPGNSGGPLVDQAGRVIGINQQIKTQSGGGEGVGFAVPVDAVKRSLAQLRQAGRARYGFLGVSSVSLYPQLVERFGLDVQRGAWVQTVEPGGPADRAGVKGGSGDTDFQGQRYKQGGDVITKLQGKPVTDPDDVSIAIAAYKPGDTITLELHRGGGTRQVRVKLGERPLGSPQDSGC